MVNPSPYNGSIHAALTRRGFGQAVRELCQAVCNVRLMPLRLVQVGVQGTLET